MRLHRPDPDRSVFPSGVPGAWAGADAGDGGGAAAEEDAADAGDAAGDAVAAAAEEEVASEGAAAEEEEEGAAAEEEEEEGAVEGAAAEEEGAAEAAPAAAAFFGVDAIFAPSPLFVLWSSPQPQTSSSNRNRYAHVSRIDEGRSPWGGLRRERRAAVHWVMYRVHGRRIQPTRGRVRCTGHGCARCARRARHA